MSLEEYVLVQERFEFSLEQMRERAANAVEASSAPSEN
jgi:aminodeoxyfutalosine deaminase